jgi:hypothetical protein
MWDWEAFRMLLYSLITGFTHRVTTKLSKGHEASINHFRNAELEFLKGIRTFIDEEIQFLDGWLEKRAKPEQKPSESSTR